MVGGSLGALAEGSLCWSGPAGGEVGASQILPAQDPVSVHPEFPPCGAAPASQGLVLSLVSGAAMGSRGPSLPQTHCTASQITCWAALGLPQLPSMADAAPELSCPAWRRGVGCTSRGHAGRLHGRPACEGGSWYQEESGRFTREPDAVISWSSRNASNFTYFLMHFTNLSKRKIVTKIPHFLGSYKTICI